MRLTLVIRDGGQKQLGLGVQSSDNLLNLVSGLILGPAVDGTDGFSLVAVPQIWNIALKLCLNQFAEGCRHLKVVGRQDSHSLLQTGDRAALLDGAPQILEQI